MTGKFCTSKKEGKLFHVLNNGGEEVPILVGSAMKVKMYGKWFRGRFESEMAEEIPIGLLNLGDKVLAIPEGSEIELI
ncbi:MAG: hypothetical protein KAX49_03230 [Halanaerobiales bacterium]|nr:hypothetical protein [Halanaerobiales bacterium]